MAGIRFREASIIPGFRLTFGFTIFYLSLIVLIPIVGLYIKTLSLSGTASTASSPDQGSWPR